ncbi:MAG: phosphatidate cytidylyltransferase, partial [Chromatiales bacterium]|nr:phosphatidate cytidylyltransferase [Chromatiales bacterium]
MLKQRLITIALLLPFFVWGIFGLSTPHFALLLAAMVLLGAWEWAALMGLSHLRRLPYLIGVIFAMMACAWLIAQPVPRMILLVFMLIWWIFALWLIRDFQREDRVPVWMLGGGRAGGHPAHPWLFGLLGFIVLVPCWAVITFLHGGIDGSGRALVFMLMLLVWGADSGAYIVGRLWGRTRLAAHVSPGKTWEGVYGALAAAVM